MAEFYIPTGTDPFYRQTTALEGVPYVFDFAFNERENLWYLSLYAVDGTPLATGMKLTVNRALLDGRRATAVPPGDLFVLCLDAKDDSPPAIDELGIGKRCTLYYVTST